MIYVFLSIVVILVVWIGRMFWVAAGQQPTGERLARCESSPNWRDGQFQNEEPTPQLTGDDGVLKSLWKFLFKDIPNLRPSEPLTQIKQNLHAIPHDAELCLWLGHSTVMIQTGGVRFLFDPVLTNRLPVWLFMRPFEGTENYTPEDIPEVDYMVITHDHWDHLDYKTVKALQAKVKHVVCPLGVGAHFEYWDYDPNTITELDWNDSININPEMKLRALPTRHFSGRLLGRGKTLWASYLIDGPRRIFVQGDGGYDGRFARYGKAFANIDLAIMENGQYDKGWRYIHLMPNELPKAIDELGPRRVLTYHNSKFSLANHAWTEPLDSISANAKGKAWKLLTPRMGETIRLDQDQAFKQWW